MPTPPDFSVGQYNTAAYMNAIGLWKVGSFTLSQLTNSITSVFTSNFESYKVVVSNFYSTTGTTRVITLRMLTGSTPDTSGNYFWNNQYLYNAGTNGVTGANSDTSIRLGLSSNNSTGQSLSFDIHNPNLATATTITYDNVVYQSDATAFVGYKGWGCANTANQYTGFQIIGTTDALAGKVTVYGYRKA